VSSTLLCSTTFEDTRGRCLGQSIIKVQSVDLVIGGVLSLNLRFAIFRGDVSLVDSGSEGSSLSAQLYEVVSILFGVIARSFATVVAKGSSGVRADD
jgi:hypothetical protein